MWLKINDLFSRVLVAAALGGLIGIFFGLLLGLIVVGIGFLLSFGSNNFSLVNMTPALMFCMGVGSVVGSVLGGLAVLRQVK